MRLFMYGPELLLFLKSDKRVANGLGKVEWFKKARARMALRRYKGNYHLSNGDGWVYGVLAEIRGFEMEGMFRHIEMSVETEDGMEEAVALLPLTKSDVNMLEIADLLWKSGLFLGTASDFLEYTKMIISCPEAEVESIPSESQYIR